MHRFALLVPLLISALPLLFLTPFPTQDGPFHLYSARLLFDVGTPGYPLLNRYLEHSPVATTTITGHGLLAILFRLAGPLWAETLLVLLFQIGLYLALAFGERDEPGALFPIAALPLVAYNFPLGMGFYNFCLSLPFAVVLLRVWMRPEPAPTRRSVVSLLGCALALTLLHPVTAAIVLVGMGAMTAAALPLPRSTDSRVREVALLVVLAIPLIALALLFPVGGGEHPLLRESPVVRAAHIVLGGAFVHNGDSIWVRAAAAVAILSLGALAIRERLTSGAPAARWVREVALLAGFLIAALLVPEEALGGSVLGVRQNLLFFLALLAFMRGWALPRRTDRILFAGFCLIGIAFVALHQRSALPMSRNLREVIAAGKEIPDHSTIIYAAPNSESNASVDPLSPLVPERLLHAGNLLGLRGDRVVLTFFEGGWPFFPVVFKPAQSPFDRIFDDSVFLSSANGFRWNEVPVWHGGVDYVAFWNEERLVRDIRDRTQFDHGFCTSYREHYRSTDGHLAIYRKADVADPRPPPSFCPNRI